MVPFCPVTQARRILNRSRFGVSRQSLDSTLAIEPHGKAHLFAFLGCPLDFSRVGVGARPAKSYRCLHRPNSPPLWCLRGGVGGDGTRDGGPRENGCRTQPTGL